MPRVARGKRQGRQRESLPCGPLRPLIRRWIGKPRRSPPKWNAGANHFERAAIPGGKCLNLGHQLHKRGRKAQQVFIKSSYHNFYAFYFGNLGRINRQYFHDISARPLVWLRTAALFRMRDLDALKPVIDAFVASMGRHRASPPLRVAGARPGQASGDPIADARTCHRRGGPDTAGPARSSCEVRIGTPS